MANAQASTRALNGRDLTLHLFLALFGMAVMAMVLFTVVKGTLKLSGPLLLYPYAIAAFIFLATLPGFVLSRRFDGFARILTPLPVLAVCVGVAAGYHLIFLEEDIGDILYIIRFYFGFFILFYGFAAFFFWLNPGRFSALAWIRKLVAVVIVLSFLMALAEVALRFMGIGAERFPWIQEATLEGLAKFESRGWAVPLRAFGLAANSAVLGGFSLFLSVYYFGLFPKGRRGLTAWAVILMGIATIFLSWSGTGLLLLVATLFVLFLRHPSSKNPLWKILFLPVAIIASAAILISQTGEEGRLSADYFDTIVMVFGLIFDFLKDYISQHLMSPLFGIMNLYQFTKPEAQQVLNWSGGLSNYYLRFYDFAYVAFLIELGLIGFLSYLILFWKLVARAFPKGEYAARWAFSALLLATIHYPVCFWVCSQVMAAAILSAHIYARSAEAA